MDLSAGTSSSGSRSGESPRRCDECSQCCTVLRVDALRKLAGVSCVHLRDHEGCSIYDERPRICRAYQCLWLKGGFEEADRPDRLGAVIDILTTGGTTRLSIQETRPGAFDDSPRLQEIAAGYRESMPVRIVATGRVSDPDRPFRVLLAEGEEHRVHGEWVDLYRDGESVDRRRLSWMQRQLRRLAIVIRAHRLRGYTSPD